MTFAEVQAAEENGDRPTIRLTSKSGVIFEFEAEIISTRIADEGFVVISLDGDGPPYDVRPEDLDM